MSDVRVVRPGDEKKTIRGVGDAYAYLADGSQTNDRYFLMEAVVPPGGGPPPHIQTREEEGFYILEGTVTFWAHGDEIEAGPGTFLHIPSGALHNFRNQGEQTAKMLIFFAPAGIEGMFDKMGEDPDNYQEIGAEYGVEFPG